MFKVLVSLILFCQVLGPVFSVCSTSCPAGQVYDGRSCSCVNKIDCANIIDDDPVCNKLSCADSADLCPNKCFCQQPSVHTNYCQPCLNGGVLNLATCGCTCQPGSQGPQCQYLSDPCSGQDEAFCSTINCYNATYSEFSKCPVKCMCCKNKACENLGTVTPTCGCDCLDVPVSKTDPTNIYDPANNCKIKPGLCSDHYMCAYQFQINTKPENCNNDFVRAMCPRACKVCA